ncbi:tol-pal system YbgF family protein [Treponema sp. C6A8]|uniref:tetratricopeptide repeat protein n=1 Tax=Treponema sp. C6A8 TaxID=1410609 RepID=UPI000481CF6B|nr:hypothetical protein [Treponema sp. C6A8]
MKKSFFIFALISAFFANSIFAERPIVQDIQALAGNSNRINLLWNLPQNPEKEITQLLVYRDLSPISSYAQLAKLEPIAKLVPILTSYTDTVKDYKDYFYAVIAVTDEPYDIILMSINSTVTGCHVQTVAKNPLPKKEEKAEKIYPEGSMREIPLPYLDYIDGLEKEYKVSQEVAASVKPLGINEKREVPRLSIHIFEEDLISPDGGDDFLLFEVLKTTFIQKKYKEAIDQLEKLVGTNISQDTRNRAYFYLGESHYMLAQYPSAIRTFVRIENIYPALCKQWIDNSLDQL